MSCSTGRLAVPLTADLTTANIYDPHMYDVLVEPLAGLIQNVAADSIYSGAELYDSSQNKRFWYVQSRDTGTQKVSV
jgi:hypothetical protein